MARNINVVVDVDLHFAPLGIFIARGGQSLQGRSIDGLERFGPATRQFLERATIQINEQCGDRGVKLGE
jgi:hypothetical protein